MEGRRRQAELKARVTLPAINVASIPCGTHLQFQWVRVTRQLKRVRIKVGARLPCASDTHLPRDCELALAVATERQMLWVANRH